MLVTFPNISSSFTGYSSATMQQEVSMIFSGLGFNSQIRQQPVIEDTIALATTAAPLMLRDSTSHWSLDNCDLGMVAMTSAY